MKYKRIIAATLVVSALCLGTGCTTQAEKARVSNNINSIFDGTTYDTPAFPPITDGQVGYSAYDADNYANNIERREYDNTTNSVINDSSEIYGENYHGSNLTNPIVNPILPNTNTVENSTNYNYSVNEPIAGHELVK